MIGARALRSRRAPAPRTKEIKFKWDADGPRLDHLSGPEAKALARQVLLKLQEEQQARASAMSVIAGLVWAQAQRGNSNPFGEPALPMRMTLDAEAVTASARRWNVTLSIEGDALAIVVDAAPAEEAARAVPA